jgi:hypothetical protein
MNSPLQGASRRGSSGARLSTLSFYTASKCRLVRKSGNGSLLGFDRVSAAWDNFCLMGSRINALDHPASF